MAKAARDAMGKKKIKALADRGYFSAPEIKACDDAGIAALVPKSQTSGAKADGRFDRADFIYVARDDQYLSSGATRDIPLHLIGECQSAEIADLLEQCLPTLSTPKTVHAGAVSAHSPMGHEAVPDRMQRRLDRQLDAMTIRRRTVEHVFGTLKHWMGATHFQMRRLGNVSTEMSLHVLAYNLKRVMKILGFAKTLRAMKLAGA
ncbi:transposase [Paraburkholderia ginsengisoli]|nr:transposase [Paraburkholderia ginsengisoli]